jgi:hypothetical protein
MAYQCIVKQRNPCRGLQGKTKFKCYKCLGDLPQIRNCKYGYMVYIEYIKLQNEKEDKHSEKN